MKVGRGVSLGGGGGGMGRVVVIYAVKIFLAGCLTMRKKLLPLMIALVVILNHLGVIHLWRPQKITNFVTLPCPVSPPPSAKLNNRSSVWKNKNLQTCDKFWDPSPCGHTPPHKCMVSYACLLWDELSVLERNTILLFERNKPIIKIFLKDISKPHKCGSSVKINGISDGILFNFMWQKMLPYDAANVCHTKKKLLAICDELNF